MNVIRVEPVSLVDWPGKVCSVVHVKGCNFSCPECFNKDLISFDMKGFLNIGIRGVLALIPEKIRHIVITGGEPTVQTGLYEFISRLRNKGYDVALHTNGSNPDLLEELLVDCMLEYVAMDVKTKLTEYERWGYSNKFYDIYGSINVIVNSGIDHEFRTTVFPTVTQQQIYNISRMLNNAGAKRYFLQKFRPGMTYEDESLTVDELNEICAMIPFCSGVRG